MWAPPSGAGGARRRRGGGDRDFTEFYTVRGSTCTVSTRPPLSPLATLYTNAQPWAAAPCRPSLLTATTTSHPRGHAAGDAPHSILGCLCGSHPPPQVLHHLVAGQEDQVHVAVPCRDGWAPGDATRTRQSCPDGNACRRAMCSLRQKPGQPTCGPAAADLAVGIGAAAWDRGVTHPAGHLVDGAV